MATTPAARAAETRDSETPTIDVLCAQIVNGTVGQGNHKAESGARMLSLASAQDAPKGGLIIVSRQPGLRRAGLVHPGVHVYASAEVFTADQMAMLLAEPLLEVIEIV